MVLVPLTLKFLRALRKEAAEARAEQERFQRHLENLGIARLSRMSRADVYASYAVRRHLKI